MSGRDDKSILCVGMCVLDIIHVCREFPDEDSDRRLVYPEEKKHYFVVSLVPLCRSVTPNINRLTSLDNQITKVHRNWS